MTGLRATPHGSLPAAQRDGFRLLVQHAPDCFLSESERSNPFVMHDGTEWNRKRNGHEGGGRAFHRFRCNDPDCPAIMLVRLDVLSDWIGCG